MRKIARSLEYRVWARQNKPKHPWILVATFRDGHEASLYRDRTEADPHRIEAKWQLLITRTQEDPNTFAEYGHDTAWCVDVDPERQKLGE